MTSRTGADRRWIGPAAALVFVLVLAASVPLLSWRVSIGDAAEAQTVPYILGIAHPTGFPAYALIGWAFSHLVPFGSIAWRLNAFTATSTAASAAAVALIAGAFGCRPAAAATAGLVFATGDVVFAGAMIANAQPLASTCTLYALLGAIVYATSGDRRVLAGAAVLAGVGMAAHPAALWVLPAIALAMVWQRRAIDLRTCALVVAGVVMPLTLYAYLPIRSSMVAAQHLDPAAEPPLRAEGVAWDTNQPRTVSGLLDELLARKERAGGSLLAAFDPRSIPGTAQFWSAFVVRQYAPWVLILAAIGAFALAREERRSLSVLAAGTLGGVLFAYQYRGDTHIDRYVVVSFAVVAVLAAASSRFALLFGARRMGLGDATPLLLAVVAAFAFAHERTRPPVPIFEDGDAIVQAVRRDTPDGAVVVAQWNEAAALGYGAFVERALGSRTIVAGWPSTYVDRYPEWLQTRRVVVFAGPLALRYIGRVAGSPKRLLPSSEPGFVAFELLR